MDKSTHEEHLSHPLQTNNKQFKIAVTFRSSCNGIFNVTNSNNKSYFKKAISNEASFVHFTIPPGGYEIESLNDQSKRSSIDEEHYTEPNYPFKTKPNFSTLGSIIEISPQGTLKSFMFDDSIKDLLGFNAITLYEDYNLSPNLVDFLSFDIFFLECNITQGMIFKGKRSGIVHNFTIVVAPGYKYKEKFRGGVQWYKMEPKDIFSSICFKLKNENNQLVSFNGQSITFRLSLSEV